MKGTKAVVGVFTYVDDAALAVKAAQTKKLDFKVYTPTYIPELDHLADTKRSKVAMFSITGALTGITAGFTLAILCGMDWPLRVSAKDIVAPPAYIVIGYETMILFGAIFTLLGLLHFCRLPDIFRKIGYDPRFSDDKFGVVIGCEPEQLDEVKLCLEKSGADEVRVEDGL